MHTLLFLNPHQWVIPEHYNPKTIVTPGAWELSGIDEDTTLSLVDLLVSQGLFTKVEEEFIHTADIEMIDLRPFGHDRLTAVVLMYIEHNLHNEEVVDDYLDFAICLCGYRYRLRERTGMRTHIDGELTKLMEAIVRTYGGQDDRLSKALELTKCLTGSII